MSSRIEQIIEEIEEYVDSCKFSHSYKDRGKIKKNWKSFCVSFV